MAEPEISYRPGELTDLPATVALYERAMSETAALQGVSSDGPVPTEEQLRQNVGRERKLLLGFLASLPDARFLVCEGERGIAGYVRVVRFGEVEELAELMVARAYRGRGVGKELLRRCWPAPGEPTAGRVVVAVGAPADLTLYSGFGLRPVTGHWHMRASAQEFLARCAARGVPPDRHVRELTGDQACREWDRLEPSALGLRRPAVHRFFADTRVCPALLDDAGAVTAVCWVAGDGNVGPAVGSSAAATAELAVACLERVAAQPGRDPIGVFCTTANRVLYDLLGELGFRVHWPSWVMSSVPLPVLDRYLPTRPPYIL